MLAINHSWGQRWLAWRGMVTASTAETGILHSLNKEARALVLLLVSRAWFLLLLLGLVHLGSPAFAHVAHVAPTHNGLMGCDWSDAVLDPNATWKGALDSALVLAVLNPQPHLLGDWTKGCGTLETQRYHSAQIKTPHFPVRVSGNSFSRDIVRTPIPAAPSGAGSTPLGRYQGRAVR